MEVTDMFKDCTKAWALHPKINLKNTSNEGAKMGGQACQVEGLKWVDTGHTTNNLIS